MLRRLAERRFVARSGTVRAAATAFQQVCELVNNSSQDSSARLDLTQLPPSVVHAALSAVAGQATTVNGHDAAWRTLQQLLRSADEERNAVEAANPSSNSTEERDKASNPPLYLLRVHDGQCVSVYSTATSGCIVESVDVPTLQRDADSAWRTAGIFSAAGRGDLNAAFIDVSNADSDTTAKVVEEFLAVLNKTGLTCWSAHLTYLVCAMTRTLSRREAVAKGNVSLTSVVPALETLPSPWTAFAPAWALLIAANRLRVPLPSLTRASGGSVRQELADLVAPQFPIYVIGLRRSEKGSILAMYDLREQRRTDCRGEPEDLLRLLMDKTTKGPIGLLYGSCDVGLLFSMTATLLRAQRLAITFRSGSVRRDFVGAAPSNDPETYVKNMCKAALHAGAPHYTTTDLLSDAVKAFGESLQEFVGDARQKSDAAKVQIAAKKQPQQQVANGDMADVVEAGTTATQETPVVDMFDDATPVVAQWLDPIYANPARQASEVAALADLTDCIVVAYSRTNVTTYQRPGNPSSPANYVTMLACRDYTGSTLLPVQHAVRRGDVALPSLDGYSVLVTHHAKDLLLLLTGDAELQRFLARGGRVWCTSVAEFALSAFQAKAPETTLSIIAATYGAPMLPDTFGEPPQTSAALATPRATTPIARAARIEERQLHLLGLEAMTVIFEGQKRRAVEQRQLVSIKLRLDAVLAFVEIERNGLMVQRDLVLSQKTDHVAALKVIDEELEKHIPRSLPPAMRAHWSWLSHKNLALYFVGGRVQTFAAAPTPSASETSTAPNDTILAMAPPAPLSELMVRLVYKAQLLEKIRHLPAFFAYCKNRNLDANPNSPAVLKALAADAEKQTYRLIIFDLETTGLDPDTDRIIEMCFFDPVAETKFSTLVNPERAISAEASVVNNITDDMVAEAPTFKDVAGDLWDYLGLTPATRKKNETVILMSHGAGSLDVPLLRRQLTEAHIIKASSKTPERFVFCDSLALFRAQRQKQQQSKRGVDLSTRSLRLNELKHRHGIRAPAGEQGAAHRAVGDSLVLWEVLAHMFDVEELDSAARVDQLLTVMGRSVANTSMNCFAAAENIVPIGQRAAGKPIVIRGELHDLYDADEVEEVADDLKMRNWDPSALEDLQRAGSKVAALLLDKGKCERLQTAFLAMDRSSNTPVYIHPDGIIRQDVKLTTATTGRTASSTPNCQNIPKSDKSEVRRIFVSRFGPEHGVCVEIDYAQLEVNVMALLSQDKGMMADLARGVDFHIKRCQGITGRPYDELKALHKAGDKDVGRLRQNAKIMSFQRMYGGGVDLLAKTTGLDREVVKRMIAAEEREYPAIPKFHKLVRALCFRDNNPGLPTRYVAEMPNGCRVSFNPSDALNNLPPMKNYPVQAYGAEVVQAALGVLARQLLSTNNYGGQAVLVNFVHDSIWFDCHIAVAPKVIADASATLASIRPLFEKAFPGAPSGVDFNVSVSVGRDMYDMMSPDKFFAKLGTANTSK